MMSVDTVVPEILPTAESSAEAVVVDSGDFYALSESQVVTMFDPLIHKLISKKLHGFESSDVCEDRDDIVQQCREHILRAHRERKWDPARGSKFESYIYLLIDSRLGNYRNKVTRKNENGTVSLTEVDGWSILDGGSRQSEGEFSSYSHMGDIVNGMFSIEDTILKRLDSQSLLNRLKGLKRTLYHEYYIEGLTVLEIHKRHPEIKYHKIRRELRLVIQFHETLVEE